MSGGRVENVLFTPPTLQSSAKHIQWDESVQNHTMSYRKAAKKLIHQANMSRARIDVLKKVTILTSEQQDFISNETDKFIQLLSQAITLIKEHLATHLEFRVFLAQMLMYRAYVRIEYRNEPQKSRADYEEAHVYEPSPVKSDFLSLERL